MPQFKHAIVIMGGSGKSAVCKLLAGLGFEIIDADSIAHEQLNLCASEVAAEFGDEVLNGGKIDRKKLGALVFNDADKLKILERILHPKIRLEILSRAAKLESAGRTYLVDIPLFFERRTLAKELLAQLKCDFPHLGVLAITHQEELKFIFDKVVGIGSS